MVQVKICGNTNLEDAQLARQYGADFLGFIFAKSKRLITADTAKQMMEHMKDFKAFVGVFANQPKEEVEKIVELLGLQWLQFHGEETSRYCDYFSQKGYKIIKTFHIKDAMSLKRIDEYNVDAFLFDTYSSKEKGGTGQIFDWSLIDEKPYVRERLFLAGGLSVDNVKHAVQTVKPYAIDVASGVEKAPGQKDPDLLREFIRLAKGDEIKTLKS
ncbi:MAG: phosphoribosylanthranilate isomerase [Candidatus Omnitrophica bacterium CG11_big_fil_rev_8_21_14_0_20_45_26]|uniref:N-(5'-phosphoribosyl)anthranilate isomerase n=1 Tax=Candidatus Abzuiibacterium crystallinum TaxID=1974748 RepID=A0A2H0LS96_9BACT|nr:MAG: phosphoribosylanthranilate isomerase [Candidatus Omnitrophica bacterium CG11_big_fil_rev_8_21_14_0_20_45_26]PIW65017.1 MAG: phosphoribosylanthranilate isomerase [Candidatus Omnitrophica bacterium CG12_big_fil_rev_8_21_14_0_65_45_16]